MRISTLCVTLFIGSLSLSASPESVAIPLTRTTDKNGDPRLQIMIGLGGGKPQPFLFDTGGSGFFARSGAYWPANSITVVTPASKNPTQQYGDGWKVSYNTVTTQIDLGGGVVANNIQIGEIIESTGPSLDSSQGNFGADLRSGTGLFSVLPQLPGNLSSGFIVKTGGYESQQPQLVIGLTDELRSEFPVTVPMRKGNGNSFPVSGYPLYAQSLVAAMFTVTRDGEHKTFEAPAILDTGGPSTRLYVSPGTFATGWRGAHHLHHGSQFQMTAKTSQGQDGQILSFTTGETVGKDLVTISDTDGPEKVNAGIAVFFENDVMFDVEKGVVGFRPLKGVSEQ